MSIADMTLKQKRDLAHRMILDAGTATYWVAEIKILTGTNKVTRGDWVNHPGLVDRIITANGQES
jgi:hypothetical protein